MISNGVCSQVMMGALFIAFQGRLWAGEARGIDCKQLKSVHVTSTRSRDEGGRQVGPAAFPRSAGLGVMPSSTDLLLDVLDFFLESVITCLASMHTNPGLPLSRLGPPLRRHCTCTLVIFSGWWIADLDTSFH